MGLFMDLKLQTVKQTFTPGPLVSCWSSRNLISYLVRAKLYHIVRVVGSKVFAKKRCEACINVCETDSFCSTVTGETFRINHKPNCDISAYFIFLRASAVANNMLEKTLGSLGLGEITINVTIGNIRGIRIVFRTIYLDIFLIRNRFHWKFQGNVNW